MEPPSNRATSDPKIGVYSGWFGWTIKNMVVVTVAYGIVWTIAGAIVLNGGLELRGFPASLGGGLFWAGLGAGIVALMSCAIYLPLVWRFTRDTLPRGARLRALLLSPLVSSFLIVLWPFDCLSTDPCDWGALGIMIVAGLVAGMAVRTWHPRQADVHRTPSEL